MRLIVLITAVLVCWDAGAAVIPPPKTYTNKFLLRWDRQSSLVVSNRLTARRSTVTNRWWVGDVTQTVYAIISTSRFEKMNVTVAAMGLGAQLSGESDVAFWTNIRPTNLIFQAITHLSPSNRLPVLIKTNPAGVLAVRLHYVPTNAVWTVPMWETQVSSDLLRWTNIGPMIVAPENPHLSLSVSNWSF